MILKINQISNVGILDVKNVELKQYSLIYGFNGSGKTTLSRLLTVVSGKYEPLLIKKISIPNVSGVCKINDEQFLLENAEVFNASLNNKLVIFNKDFVDENVFPKAGLNQVVISKENHELEARKLAIEECKKEILLLQSKYGSETGYHLINKDIKGLLGLSKQEEKIDSDITKSKTTYASQIKGVLDGDEYKNYDRNKLEAAIKLIETSIAATKQEVSYKENLDFEALKKEIGNQKAEINTVKDKISDDEIRKINALESDLGDLGNLIEGLEKRLSDKVEISNSDIKLLTDDIKSWLQSGLAIHQKHKKLDQCLFCDNDLKDRIGTLQNAFGGKYDEVRQQLQSNLEIIERVKDSFLKFVANQSIKASLTFDEAKNTLLLNCKKLCDLINGKQSQMSETTQLWDQDFLKENFLKNIEVLTEELKKIRSSYDAYNASVANSESYKKEGYKKLLKALVVWFLENSYDDKNYSELSNQKKIISGKIAEIKVELKNTITEKLKVQNQKFGFNFDLAANEDFISNVPQCLKIELSSISKQAANIEISMGRIENYFKLIINTDLKLREHKDESGITSFKLVRNNIDDAVHILSEGEKTALAFAYFLTKLEEDSNIKNSQKIVVIDDPISSLDYNVLYSIYNLIYHKIYKLKKDQQYAQAIVMTHNWYFANLMYNGIVKKKKDGEGCFLEIARNQNGKSEIRSGKKNFLENEYLYLFNYILEVYDKIKNGRDVDLYGIGNACRRFIELFCQFYYHDQIESLFSEADNGLCRFLHISSHGEIIPDKMVINLNAKECSKNIENLLTLIQKHLENKDSCRIRTKLKEINFSN